MIWIMTIRIVSYNTQVMKKTAAIFFFLIISAICYSQEVISYVRFMELVRWGGTIEHYIVEPPDESYIDVCFDEQNTQPIEVEQLFIINCSFDRLVLHKLHVKTHLTIGDCVFRNSERIYSDFESMIGDVIFSNIHVEGQCNLINNVKKESPLIYEVEESIFGHFNATDENELQTAFLRLSYSEIKYSFAIDYLRLKSLELTETSFCKDVPKQEDWRKGLYNPRLFSLNVSDKKTEALYITDCQFYVPVNFKGIFIPEEFTIDETKFYAGVDFTNAKINPALTQLQWSSLSSSLISSEEADDTQYQDIQNSYLILLDYFRAKNLPRDRKQCFVEYKDFERKHYGQHIFHGSAGEKARNTVTYLFLSALRWTSNYSTDFIRTIWRTTLLIGIFGIFYFLYNSLIYNNFKIYFFLRRNNKGKYIRRIFKGTKHLLEKANRLFGATFVEYTFAEKKYITKRLKTMSWMKFTWVYFIRELIVSFFASLNFFVTLGFAGVSLNGKLKYVAIIEGMLGWLILVILSAALVNSFIMI